MTDTERELKSRLLEIAGYDDFAVGILQMARNAGKTDDILAYINRFPDVSSDEIGAYAYAICIKKKEWPI